uniref:DEP domain-containing protein n=1 Tax=Globodera pallida TaxID=36090 RepID=A0A183C0M1_GLOPA
MELPETTTTVAGDDQQNDGQNSNNNDDDVCHRRRQRRCCSRRRSFTIAPIEGMEWMQECHPSYGIDGDMAAKRLLEEKKLTLSRRFQLIERGYVLKLKNNNNNNGERKSGAGAGQQQKHGCDCGCCRVSLFDRLTVHFISGFDKMANTKQGTAESESGKQCQER